jgi:hypothetical protein
VILAALAATTMGSVPTLASATVYDGKIKGMPGSDFDVEIEKAANGTRRVDRLGFDGVTFECEDGPQPTGGSLGFSPPKPLVRQGAFDARIDDGSLQVKVDGAFSRGGRLRGDFSYRYEVPPPRGTCKTGKLEYVAKKAVNRRAFRGV